MVTAETAAVLPALVAVLAGLLWVLSAGAAAVRCQDAAYEAARALARGEAPAVATQVAGGLAPAGATVRLATTAMSAEAVVSVTVSPAGGLLRRAAVTVRSRAVVPRERGPAGAPAASVAGARAGQQPARRWPTVGGRG